MKVKYLLRKCEMRLWRVKYPLRGCEMFALQTLR